VNSHRVKVLVLALDGFDPDLFVHWQDSLPNLNRLADKGHFSPINSTTPPMTFPAWSTLLTGVNPAKHGIFDFTERIPDKYGVRFLNATRRKFPTFLKLLSAAGLKVGSVGIPTTYPPETLSAFQISGFDTPLPSKADTSYIYPRELAVKIEKELGGYYFGDFNESKIDSRWHSRVLKDLLTGIERKIQLAELLLQEYPLDLLLFHLGETDTVGHHFWSFYDENSPRYVSSDDEDLPEAIFTVYKAVDDFVGQMIDLTSPDSVIIVSDHGMGGTSDCVLYLNRFLADYGLLKFAENINWSKYIDVLKKKGMKWIPYGLQQQVFRLADGKIASNIESIQRFSGIDWMKTTAYSEELNYFPSIWINLEGREPAGIAKSADYDKTVRAVCEAVKKWKDPQSYEPVVRKAYRREEIYEGSEIEYAPDVILELNQPDGYSYALGKSRSAACSGPWRKLQSREHIGYKGGSMNGSHRQKGTFIIESEGMPAQTDRSLSLLDVAPTVMSLLHMDIPAWMEGKSLSSGRISPQDRDADNISVQGYSDREEEALRRQLENLGYLD
jgi:predicted AlkP superfamily phosphohydrolase/phosphomutase